MVSTRSRSSSETSSKLEGSGLYRGELVFVFLFGGWFVWWVRGVVDGCCCWVVVGFVWWAGVFTFLFTMFHSFSHLRHF